MRNKHAERKKDNKKIIGKVIFEKVTPKGEINQEKKIEKNI